MHIEHSDIVTLSFTVNKSMTELDKERLLCTVASSLYCNSTNNQAKTYTNENPLHIKPEFLFRGGQAGSRVLDTQNPAHTMTLFFLSLKIHLFISLLLLSSPYIFSMFIKHELTLEVIYPDQPQACHCDFQE